MEVAFCAACPHPRAAHAGGGRGGCRGYGCPCLAFAAVADPAPDGEVLAVPAAGPLVSVQAFTAVVSAIAFVVGLLIGLWL